MLGGTGFLQIPRCAPGKASGSTEPNVEKRKKACCFYDLNPQVYKAFLGQFFCVRWVRWSYLQPVVKDFMSYWLLSYLSTCGTKFGQNKQKTRCSVLVTVVGVMSLMGLFVHSIPVVDRLNLHLR